MAIDVPHPHEMVASPLEVIYASSQQPLLHHLWQWILQMCWVRKSFLLPFPDSKARHLPWANVEFKVWVGVGEKCIFIYFLHTMHIFIYFSSLPLGHLIFPSSILHYRVNKFLAHTRGFVLWCRQVCVLLDGPLAHVKDESGHLHWWGSTGQALIRLTP